MKIALIAAPYDLGYAGAGMALGPTHYLNAGADRSLSERGFEVETEVVERYGSFEDELGATSEVNAAIARHVREATERGDFPLVLGGNCDSAIGVMAGLDPSRVGVIWFDAHGDFGTPETTPSGYLGSMPLSTITGHCHKRIREHAGNEASVLEGHVVMISVRAAEPEQSLRLENSAVRVFGAEGINSTNEKALLETLEELRSQVEEIYIHLDIDSLDPEHAPGVDFPAGAGLSPEDVEVMLRKIGERFDVKAASMTAFNPERDEDDRTLHAGTRLMAVLAEVGAGREFGDGR